MRDVLTIVSQMWYVAALLRHHFLRKPATLWPNYVTAMQEGFSNVSKNVFFAS